MFLYWTGTGHAKSRGRRGVDSRGHALVVWLTAPVFAAGPSISARPPTPVSALSFVTPDTSPELAVNSPVLKFVVEVVKVPQHRCQVGASSNATTSSQLRIDMPSPRYVSLNSGVRRFSLVV